MKIKIERVGAGGKYLTEDAYIKYRSTEELLKGESSNVVKTTIMANFKFQYSNGRGRQRRSSFPHR